jgi:DNA adenine methylase
MAEAAAETSRVRGDGSVRALLKWVGSKARLIPALTSRPPEDIDELRHVEPFCGSAALFFAQRPAVALLADQNGRLIETLRSVRDEPEAVIEHLEAFQAEHNNDLYYETRYYVNLGCLAGALHAAAFLYLNRTCFNGLYRENRKGEFNVPVGRYDDPKILDAESVREAAARLRCARLVHESFEHTVLHCGPSDFVYLDPPYEPLSETSSFTAYNRAGFQRKEQERLRSCVDELTRIGARVMLSNSDTEYTRALYSDYVVDSVEVHRSVSAGKRGTARELIVRNYGQERIAL